MLVTNIVGMTTSRGARTRARLQAAALELFAERGFDATTVEQIAARAGVSHMTFFRYFPTKESVVVEDPYDPLIADAVRAQPTDLMPLERVRRGLLAAWQGAPLDVDEETRERVAIMAAYPQLRAKAWENTRETERVVVEALMAAGTPRREAAVAAGAVMGAVMAALLDWASTPGETGADLGPAIVAALAQLEVASGATGRPGPAETRVPDDEAAHPPPR